MTPNAAPDARANPGTVGDRPSPGDAQLHRGRGRLAAACTVARISNIVTSRAFLEKARLTELIAQLPNIQIHYLEDMKARVRLGTSCGSVGTGFSPALLASVSRPEDAAIVLFTSGSEGRPRASCTRTIRCSSNVAQIRAVADFTPLDKFMIALPVFHSFGLACGIIMPLVSGCKAFLYPSPLHYRIIPELVYDRNCTVLFGTSTFLANYGKFAHPYDFGRLRYVVAGAEKLSDEVRRLWIEKFGIRVLEGYGVTECAPVIAVNVPMACRIGSVGQLVPGMEYELGVRTGHRGCRHAACYRPEYHERLPAIRAARRHPAAKIHSTTAGIRTGDIVHVDGTAFCISADASSASRKMAGEMISLEVVERIAASASSGFCTPLRRRSRCRQGRGLVLFTTDATLKREQLSAAAKSLGLPELAVPRILKSVKEIPLLGSGKTDYVQLKKMAEASTPQEGPAADALPASVA